MTDEESTEPDLSTVLASRSYALALLNVMVNIAEADGDRVLRSIARRALDALNTEQAAFSERLDAAHHAQVEVAERSAAVPPLEELLYPPDQY